MNPYANAFSQLMSQFSTTNCSPTPHQTSASPPLPPYHVYVPGAIAPTTIPSPYAAIQQAQYPYPMYPQYPGAPMYSSAHNPYPSQHVGHVYATPTVYPMVPNAAHQIPSSFHPQRPTFQNKNHFPPKNHSKQFNKSMQKKHNITANVPSVTPTTPAAAVSSQISPYSTNPSNANNQSFSFPSCSETANGVSGDTLPSFPSSYFCEACDKEFPNQSTYNSHCSTHEMCSYPGCNFTASKRVVQAHFHSTHGLYSGQGYKDIDVEGQSFRVLLGTSPEEVAQWRAERRKKFPSSDRASISTNNDTAEVTNSLENGNKNSNNGQKGKKSLAAQKREEWKLKKQQQRLERQHYKQLRNAHHGQNNISENDANDDHEQPSRNFIQIKSQTSTKGIEISTVMGQESTEEVTSIRLPPSAEGNDGNPAKRARFDSTADISPQKQRQQRNSKDKKRQPNNSLLRKPDISGNLLAKLLLNEIRAEENLLLQSIRFLRQLYDPRCQVFENVNATALASDEHNSTSKTEDAKDVTNLTTEEKQRLIQQLTTMDIDELITEAHNVPDDFEEGAEEGLIEEEEEEEIESEDDEEEGEVKDNETNDD